MKIRKLSSAKDVKKFIDSSKTGYVKVALTDIDGILRGKYMHVDKFIKSTEKGFGLCDVIFGWDSNDELYYFGRTPEEELFTGCLLYTSPSPRDLSTSRMPSSA